MLLYWLTVCLVFSLSQPWLLAVGLVMSAAVITVSESGVSYSHLSIRYVTTDIVGPCGVGLPIYSHTWCILVPQCGGVCLHCFLERPKGYSFHTCIYRIVMFAASMAI